MIHDFLITENYVIIPDLPLEFNPPKAVKNKGFVFQFDEQAPSRYGVMKKGQTDVKWFSLPNHYIFHYVNAWEEGPVIKMFAVVHESVRIGFNTGEHPFLHNKDTKNIFSLHKIELNLETGEEIFTKMISDMSFEFPTINLNYVGSKNKYCYMAYMADKVGEGPGANENVFLKGFIKYDLENEEIISKIDFGATHTGQEVYFQPREGATEEDDGYLMTTIHDWTTDKS